MTDSEVAQNLRRALKLFNEALADASKRDIIADLAVSDFEILELEHIGESGYPARYRQVVSSAPQVRIRMVSKLLLPREF